MVIVKTKEKAKELANKCLSRIDFYNKYQTWYVFSRKNKWLDEFFGKKVLKYSIKENVINEAKKYKTLKEFHDKNGNAWKAAKKNGWAEEMFWLNDKNSIVKNRKYYVYKIEIEKLNSVYIGITCQKKGKRWHEHNSYVNKKTGKYDTIKQFCIDNFIDMPYEIIIKENLTCDDAQYYEKFYIDKFKSEGRNVLNKGKCGIGSSSIGNAYKWLSEDKIINEGKKFKTREEFKNCSPGAHSAAARNGLFEKIFGPGGGLTYLNWKDKKTVVNEGLKYKSRADFYKKNCSAYFSAIKNGWIDEIFPLDKETVKIEALKYKNGEEFRKNNLPLYKKASHEKWIDEWFPINEEVLNKITIEYKNITEFKYKRYYYYNKAKKLGILKKLKFRKK